MVIDSDSDDNDDFFLADKKKSAEKKSSPPAAKSSQSSKNKDEKEKVNIIALFVDDIKGCILYVVLMTHHFCLSVKLDRRILNFTDATFV